jgi:hypothetical protein
MTKRNRNTLKKYFTEGALPTSSNFVDLVESTLNMADDGFSRSPANGVEIRLPGDDRTLMSFFGDAHSDSPDWAINSEAETGKLSILHTESDVAPKNAKAGQTDITQLEVLTLSPDGNVGVNVSDPAYRLHVDGVVASTGRFGKPGSVEADGQWHEITDWLDGCHAFEVIAGAGLYGKKKGKYALLHAFAMNTFNPKGFFFNFRGRKNKIRCHHAWYLSRGDRLRIRWFPNPDPKKTHEYRLELASMTDYGVGISIQYSITDLWLDVYMGSGQGT